MIIDILFINDKQIPTKVAITEEEHSKGLMFQKQAFILTFPYDTFAVRKFWMKDVPIPIDIIFCRAGKVIEICAGIPFSDRLVGPEFSTDLVIEMPKGKINEYKINCGDDVKLQLCRKTALKKIINKLSSRST